MQVVRSKSTFVVDEEDPTHGVGVHGVVLGRILPDEVGSEAFATSIACAPHRLDVNLLNTLEGVRYRIDGVCCGETPATIACLEMGAEHLEVGHCDQCTMSFPRPRNPKAPAITSHAAMLMLQQIRMCGQSVYGLIDFFCCRAGCGTSVFVQIASCLAWVTGVGWLEQTRSKL